MARARNIKPGFFKNEGLGEVPFGARLLFAGLWTLADRDGRLEDRPGRIAGELFPYDREIGAAEIDGWLNLLAQSSEAFVIRYSAMGIRYLQIANFGKHQSPHVKEQASTIPAPDEHRVDTVQAPDEHQTSTGHAPDEHLPGQCVAPPDSLIPSSLNPSIPNGAKSAPRRIVDPELKTTAKRIYDRHPEVRRSDCSLARTEKLLSAIAKRHAKGGRTRSQVLEIVDRNHSLKCASPQWREDNGQYSKGLHNFLAPTRDLYLNSGADSSAMEAETAVSQYPLVPDYAAPEDSRD